MHISELTLINVRTFSHRVFTFKPGFNLIVGENGAGKTTILRALQTLLSANRGESISESLADQDITIGKPQLIVEGKCQDGKRVEQLSPFIKNFRKRRVVLERKVSGKDVVISSSEAIVSGAPDRWPIGLLYGPIESTSGYLISPQPNPVGQLLEAKRSRDENWLYSNLKKAEFGYAGLEYTAVRKMLGEFIQKFTDFNWQFKFDACVVNWLTPELKFNHRFEKYSPRLRRVISNAVTRFLKSSPEVLKSVDSRMAMVSADGIITTTSSGKVGEIPPFFELIRRYHNNEILFRTSSSGYSNINSPHFESKFDIFRAVLRFSPRIKIIRDQDELTLEQMSHGEQRIFSLMVDITRQLKLREQQSRPPHNVEAVVLIDEIDIHLHPKWQREIVPALEKLFPSCQFIATTHSPYIVQSVDEGRVQHLNRKLMGDFTDRGIEEITVKVMGIEQHEVSVRYLELLDKAREYFRLLEKTKGASAPERKKLQKKLKAITEPYARNPAYQAFLEMHRIGTLGAEGKK